MMYFSVHLYQENAVCATPWYVRSIFEGVASSVSAIQVLDLYLSPVEAACALPCEIAGADTITSPWLMDPCMCLAITDSYVANQLVSESSGVEVRR
jgi:hypothetical protein